MCTQLKIGKLIIMIVTATLSHASYYSVPKGGKDRNPELDPRKNIEAALPVISNLSAVQEIPL